MSARRPSIDIPFRRARLVVAAAVVAAMPAGCASLDPTEDLGRAATLVTARSASETGWDAPWRERAAQWDGVAPLAPDVAVRVALQNNRAIRRDVESIVAARADVVQAHLLPNPVINVAVGLTTDGLGGDPLMAALVQPLAWLWLRPAAIDGADAELRARVLAVSDAALELVARVRGAHAEVWFAQESLALQEENLALLERAERLLDDRFQVGEASRLDVNRVALDRRAAEVRLEDHRAALGRAKRDLLALLGRAGDDVTWSCIGDERLGGDATDGLDEATVVALARAQRLDVAAARATADARRAGVDLQDGGRLPDVSAGVGFQENFSGRQAVFPSIGVTPKLFDDNSARVARAVSALRQAEIEADRVLQEAVAETRRAWVSLGAERAAVRAYEERIVALAESNHVLAQAAFDAGETDLTVLLEAQRRLNDARIALADRRLAAAARFIDLERAAGGSLAAQPPLPEALASGTGGRPGGAPPEETMP